MAATEPTPAAKLSTPEGDVWKEALWLPCRLTVKLPIPHFTVGDLLNLEVKSVVDSQVEERAELPIHVSGQLVGWGKFEVVEGQLAIRVTELA